MKLYFLEDGKTPMPAEGGQGLKVSTFYSKGGTNFYTYKQEPRGYYLSVTRVVRKISESGLVSESCMMFTGGKKRLLLEVKRQSPKALALAEEKAKEVMTEVMVKVLSECTSSAGV